MNYNTLKTFIATVTLTVPLKVLVVFSKGLGLARSLLTNVLLAFLIVLPVFLKFTLQLIHLHVHMDQPIHIISRHTPNVISHTISYTVSDITATPSHDITSHVIT